jgi:hypothetical protein
MNLEKANDYLLEQGFPEYDIQYMKAGEMYVAYTRQQPSRKPADELLEQTIDIFTPERLFLVPRKQNGTVSKKTAPIEIELPDSPNQKVSGLNGFAQPTTSPATAAAPANSGYESYKDFIIRDLQEKLHRAERKTDEQEKKLERLKEEKAELEKNVAFKDKEFELAIKEKDGEQKNSLNGFVSSLKEPETIQALAGLASAIREMRGPQAVDVTNANLPEGIEMEDLQDQYIYNVVVFMSRASQQVRQKIYQTIERAVNRKHEAA